MKAAGCSSPVSYTHLDDGFLEVAHELNEGAVREVRRGYFEYVHHVVEEFGGLHVERGGHEGDTGLIAMLFQVFEFAFPERVVLFEQLVLARGRLFAGVPVRCV